MTSWRDLTRPPRIFTHSTCPVAWTRPGSDSRSEEHTSELQSHLNLVCRLLLEKKKKNELNHRLVTHLYLLCDIHFVSQLRHVIHQHNATVSIDVLEPPIHAIVIALPYSPDVA